MHVSRFFKNLLNLNRNARPEPEKIILAQMKNRFMKMSPAFDF